MFEDAVNQQRADEIGNDQPRRPPGRRPQIKQFVNEKDENEQADGHPFVAQASRPVEPGLKETARGLTRKHERTSQAEEVVRDKDNQDQHASKMNPTQRRRQISGRQLGAEQTVQDHQDADKENRNLRRRPRMPPAKKSPQQRHLQQIQSVRTTGGKQRTIRRLIQQRISPARLP